MNAEPSEISEAGALASMFDPARIKARPWGDHELAAVLRHQLDAPLATDLGTMRGVTVEQVERLARGASPERAPTVRGPGPGALAQGLAVERGRVFRYRLRW